VAAQDSKPENIFDEDGWSRALRHTVRQVYLHPGIPDAFRYNTGRPSDGAALAAWLESRPVVAWLGTSIRQDKIAAILDAAESWLEQEQERLRQAYQLARVSGQWDGLPPAARQLASLLCALAARQGPEVLLSHDAALFGIELAGGKRYKTKATITNAREALIDAGMVTVEVGTAWEKGKRAKASRYNMLPPAVRDRIKSELCTIPAPKCIVQFERPVMTDDQYQQMKRCYAELARSSQQAAEPAEDPELRKLVPEYAPVPARSEADQIFGSSEVPVETEPAVMEAPVETDAVEPLRYEDLIEPPRAVIPAFATPVEGPSFWELLDGETAGKPGGSHARQEVAVP
jgi:hypothetical protein